MNDSAHLFAVNQKVVSELTSFLHPNLNSVTHFSLVVGALNQKKLIKES